MLQTMLQKSPFILPTVQQENLAIFVFRPEGRNGKNLSGNLSVGEFLMKASKRSGQAGF